MNKNNKPLFLMKKKRRSGSILGGQLKIVATSKEHRKRFEEELLKKMWERIKEINKEW